MGIIQGAINSAISGTAYMIGAEARKEANSEATKKRHVKEAYSQNAKKGWQTRRENAMKSLEMKNDVKINGIMVANRMKKGSISDVKPA